MTIISPPIIKKITKKPYTIITFTPDYSRFNNNGLSQDMYNVMCKRVYDLCALTDPSVSVYINDEKILIKNFEKYSELFDNNLHVIHKFINLFKRYMKKSMIIGK